MLPRPIKPSRVFSLVSEFICPLNPLHFQSCPYEQGFFQLDAPINCGPIDIREKRFNVLRPSSQLVVQEIGVFPNVHDEERMKTRDIANFMKRDPVIRHSPVCWILIADRPTDAAHFSNAREVCFPHLIAAKAVYRRLIEIRIASRVTRPILLHVFKVVLMQDHAVVLKAESSGELGVSRHLLLVYNSVSQDVGDSLIEIVSSFYITLVQLEMHLKSLVRDAVQAAEVELTRVVHIVDHFVLPVFCFLGIQLKPLS